MPDPKSSASGTPRTRFTAAPIAPASAPTAAPSPARTGNTGDWLISILAATMPPIKTHIQQHALPRLTNGIADRIPRIRPPTRAGASLLGFSTILRLHSQASLQSHPASQARPDIGNRHRDDAGHSVH